tara:strand:+ start:152 stop:547 length:396 start_codon:yes stop_codon:yes gene_type:complete
LRSVNPKKPYRWVLLRHIGAPDDLRGIHYDLLLEDDDFCRTWRLSDIPFLDGPYVDSVYSTPHKLEWLDIQEKVVSGNRGVATRIKKGTFLQSLPIFLFQKSSLSISLNWDGIYCDLVIDENGCRIFSKKK